MTQEPRKNLSGFIEKVTYDLASDCNDGSWRGETAHGNVLGRVLSTILAKRHISIMSKNQDNKSEALPSILILVLF